MNKYLFLMIYLVTNQVNAQYIDGEIDANNSSAMINSGGVFFNNFTNSSPGYEYPVGSGNHLIYATSFWFGGEDINNQIKLSGQKYTPGKDLFPGPLSIGDATIIPSVSNAYNFIFSVTKSEIDYHIQNYSSISYSIPASIANWPVHGDVSLNQDFYLAPFVDVNSNGLYDPENGDYPLIRGDEATFLIMNDKLDVHTESGGDPIGIECHFMFYQYSTADDLNNTTFVNIKLINRGTQTLYGFTVGAFLDVDLGTPSDDFMGCDSIANLLYAYNGFNMDADYGANPPAVGIISLNHDLATAGAFTGVAATGIPSTAAQYYLNMTGFFNDGSPRTLGGNGYGGTVTNKFQYHGNPNNLGEWSEYNEGNTPGDRQMFCSTKTITLTPFDEICYDFAIVVGDGGDFLENVDSLITAASLVQDFFDNQGFECENVEYFLSAEKEADIEISIYPQPSTEGFRIEAPSQFDYKIYSIDGQLVSYQNNILPNTLINPNITSGSYIIQIAIEGNVVTKKIVVD